MTPRLSPYEFFLAFTIGWKKSEWSESEKIFDYILEIFRSNKTMEKKRNTLNENRSHNQQIKYGALVTLVHTKFIIFEIFNVYKLNVIVFFRGRMRLLSLIWLTNGFLKTRLDS